MSRKLKMREQRMKSRDAKRIRGIVHENDENKGASHEHDEMSKLMRHDELELLSRWHGWHWDDNTCGWLGPDLCAVGQGKQRGGGAHSSSKHV